MFLTRVVGDGSILNDLEGRTLGSELSRKLLNRGNLDQPHSILSLQAYFPFSADGRQKTMFVEAHRALADYGQCLIADQGEPPKRLMRYTFYRVQLIDGFENTDDNIAGNISSIMQDVGFTREEKTKDSGTPLCTITLLQPFV